MSTITLPLLNQHVSLAPTQRSPCHKLCGVLWRKYPELHHVCTESPRQDVKAVIVPVIKALLASCEATRGRYNKTVIIDLIFTWIANNLWLHNYERFHTTVVKKLDEFEAIGAPEELAIVDKYGWMRVDRPTRTRYGRVVQPVDRYGE